MNRSHLFQTLRSTPTFDIAIVGGGATGLGVALDASLRGFSVLLVESHDFAKGTSSRATKLVHGGVRYLAQGNIALVREALHERTTLLQNAPHLASALPFVMPSYHCWETPFYGAGLKMYDLLAGNAALGPTELLSRAETLRYLPNAKQAGLCGGVKYWDGQFDDARLALALAKTAARAGALVINYCQATDLIHHAGKVAGLQCQDQETGQRYDVQARCVVNATGVWVDTLRQADARATGRTARAMVAPSQGVHVVVDRAYLPTDHALLIPKTADARVLFAVPWLGKTILGTTDSPRQTLDREPNALKEELDFILNESARYLQRAPTKADIKSVWVGLRPLVKPSADDGESTQALSREHTVLCSRSGLVTVTGGKWTTYRAMAEDVLDNCFEHGLLEERERCTTAHHRLVGAGINSIANKSNKISGEPGLHSYGNEADEVQSHAGADQFLAPGLTEAMVRFAVRCEYARTVEDILARRSRLLFLDAALAKAIAPQIAEILAKEALPSPALAAFVALADHYLQMPS